MKILVPIKRVVDPYAKVRPLPDGSGLDSGGAKCEINPFDEIAVEEAVRLRERLGSAEIVVVTLGPSAAEEQLRKALAMGADRAILVETDADLDSSAVAKELAHIVGELAPDLVLMGKQATDDDNNQVGQMLAARLNWPQATFASKVEITGTTAVITRETDLGSEVLTAPLPVVVTADLRLNGPRYVALPGIIKARSKPLERRAPATNPTARTRVVKYDAPPARAQAERVANVDALISALKARGVL